jgi:hypothetical protein
MGTSRSRARGDATSQSTVWSRLGVCVTCASCACVGVLLLGAAARPLATDDAWWHLALGRVFAREGPWLGGDPLLFAAAGPASSASWLADVGLAQALELGGFTGLRIAHVALVAAILVLASVLLRREAASWPVAALTSAAFATLAAYRLFQLRPELVTLLATLLLYGLVLRPREGPSAVRVAGFTLGMAAWANLHAGFLLGPILVAVALAGIAGAALVAGSTPASRARMRRLLLAGVLGTLVTFVNPSGAEPHQAWFRSGVRTPGLTFLSDEWRPLALLSAPGPVGPPSLAAWLLVWALLAGTLATTAVAFARWRRHAPSADVDADAEVDPALVALAWASLAAMTVAVRFTWLAIFPLLLLAQVSAAMHARARAATTAASALLALALLAGFVWIGPWPRISDVIRAVPMTRPYAAEKYFVAPIWLMRDAGLEGRLFTDYELGGFAGFWLAPRIQALVNGSMNVTSSTLEAYFAIKGRRGRASGETFPDLLDREGLDLFLGTGVPDARRPAARATTAWLEATPGWIPIFRNATSALYLRSEPRNATNLRRIADHYRREGVPFDAVRGFEPGRVIRERPDWAIRQGLIPEDFPAIERAAAGATDPGDRLAALRLSASVHALLGLYAAALEREAEIRRLDPKALDAARRSVWCLLRAGRIAEARVEATVLRGSEGRDALARHTAALARALPALSEDEAQAAIQRLPLLTLEESQAITRRLRAAPIRNP